jgi:hypothetical protein
VPGLDDNACKHDILEVDPAVVVVHCTGNFEEACW